jgi:hypothetical protein
MNNDQFYPTHEELAAWRLETHENLVPGQLGA